MNDAAGSLVLAMAFELDELRRQLATAQDLLVETAIDAGHLHAQIEGLQAELAKARADCDLWRQQAEHARRVGWRHT